MEHQELINSLEENRTPLPSTSQLDLPFYDEITQDTSAAKVKKFCTDTYNTVKDYRVSLDRDPSAQGVSSLNVKLADAREYANHASTIKISAIRLVASLTDSHLILTETIDDLVETLKTTEQDCISARGYEEKRKIAESLLPNYIKTKRASARRLEEAKTCLKVVSIVCDTLTNTKEDILSQLGVIKQQLLIGELSLKIDKETAKLFMSEQANRDSSITSLQEGPNSF